MWQWDSSGSVAGGAVYRTDVEAISTTLAYGLWDFLEIATRRGLRPVVLNFPRFARDFDYLWDQLGWLIESRQSEAGARSAWNRVVDPQRIRIDSGKDAHEDLKVRELESLVRVLRDDNRAHREALQQMEEYRRELEYRLAQGLVIPAPPSEVDEKSMGVAQDVRTGDLEAAERERDVLRGHLLPIENSRIWKMSSIYRRARSSFRDH